MDAGLKIEAAAEEIAHAHDSVLEGLRRRSVTAEQVYKDWRVLRILWESCHKGSDAGLKIEAAAEEIAHDLNRISDGEEEDNEVPESQFLLQLARDCETKTKRLMAEVGEALDYLYSSCSTGGSTISSSLQSQLMPPATLGVSFWPRFVSHAQSNVLRIRQIVLDHLVHEHFGIRDQVFTFYNSLKSIKRYFGLLLIDPKFPYLGGAGAGATTDDAVPGIDASLGHVVSLVLRIANRCSDHWLDCKTGRIQVEKGELSKFMEDLHHEIHPRNPNFMRFHLNFLLALCCSNNNEDEKMDIVMQFCNYLFNSEHGDFRKEVSSLVTLFVDATTKLKNKDAVQSFFPEINAMLVEMASLFEANSRKGHKLNDSPQCSELLTRICLLRAELSLVVQIRNMSKISSNLSSSSSMLSDWKDIPRNLSIYSKNLPLEKIEDGETMLAFTESLFEEVESLHQSFRDKKITGPIVKNSLLLLFFKIVIFREELFLTELLLLKSDPTPMAGGKDRIVLHLQNLEYFSLILSDERMKNRKDVFRAFKPIEVFFRSLTIFNHSFLIAQDEMILSFSQLLDKMNQLMKAKCKEIIPQFPLFAFPRTFRLNLNFVDSLSRNLVELLKYDPVSIALVKHHIEEIQLHLQSLSSFLVDVSKLQIEEDRELKDIGNQIIHLAYKAEYVIDSIEVDAQWQDFFWLNDVLQELRVVNEKACGIQLTIGDAKVLDPENVTHVSRGTFPRDGTPAIDEIVVDLSNRENEILNQLTRGSSRLDIVFIAGMPGLGKTTLARKVYSSLKVMCHFHLRAWCSVSQEYEKRRLLLEILTGIHGLTEEIRQMRDEDLQDKLRELLKRNKYLVVMDDVWGIGVWNDLKNSFPDDGNGSRILFTSRLHRVALEIKPDSRPLSLSLFSHEESWQLLEKKVFKVECCPKELAAVGKEIARQCQGLPLAIVAVAGILKMTEKSRNSWKKIANSLSSQVLNGPEAQGQSVPELSYQYLPEYLKPCFLYMGVLGKDKDILVSKLIQLWLAEGLIPKTQTKSFEDLAEDFLMELIDASLVIISKRRSNGKVKACRLHSFMLDFCLSKAEEANFFQLVTRCDKPYAWFPSSDYSFEFDFYHLPPVSFASYRLAVSLKQNHFLGSRPSGLGTRSLVFFASTDSKTRRPYDISLILHNFKLLKVLDFECMDMASFPVEIGLLIHLRYLAVGGYVTSIPKSLGNLRKLETLIVKGLSGKIILPDTIWSLTSLRHLHVKIHVAFNLDDAVSENCSVLENLVSFSCLSLSCGEDAERMLKRFPNLCKLSGIFYESPDSSTNCNQFPRLKCLTHLESLKIFYYGSPLNNGEFILPLNLKKLTLSNFRLPWSHISTIGRLPNLEVLKLLSGAFEGMIWDVEEEFQNLKFLSLDNLNIVQWNASCDDFPKLERLVLQNCKDLEEIPSDFVDILSLQLIEVNWCGRSVEGSALNISKETGEVKVVIKSSYWRS
ncbi:putative late blight resistance protein homolog R1A-4 [Coffea arabica]|uniref:Late blight resistance protein homolog R1A-4 n=1 Tax=Coffea arabica TaxID=13443 RepID=A0A6P6X194_COFAR